MNVRTTVRTLAAAAMLALAAVSVSTPQAHARSKDPYNGVRCAVPGPQVGEDDTDWVFFLPGEEIVQYDKYGRPHTLRCGSDGNWHLARSVTGAGIQVVGLQSLAIAP